jgi:glucosamine kinase
MIAVVYSGSNFANWKLAQKQTVVQSFKTNGINPFTSDEKSILSLLNKNIHLIHHAEEIKKIYFFGPGIVAGKQKQIVTNAFSKFFRCGKVIVETDIYAAALATCQDKPGIVCILGSGSNAAYFDGKKIKPNNYGLGYILADEGSANWIGMKIVKSFLNKTLPDELTKKFTEKFDLDRKIILDKVYKQPQPAVFFSSFRNFAKDNISEAYMHDLVKSGFRKFLSFYTLPLLAENPGVPVYFVGTIASIYQNLLQEAAQEQNISIKNIIKEPINNLLTYYINKN